jgi:hypothetical protein
VQGFHPVQDTEPATLDTFQRRQHAVCSVVGGQPIGKRS